MRCAARLLNSSPRPKPEVCRRVLEQPAKPVFLCGTYQPLSKINRFRFELRQDLHTLNKRIVPHGQSIVLPIDLAHTGALTKAIDISADIAKSNGAKLTMVGVTSSAPTEASRNPKEFNIKLAAFAEEIAAQHDIKVETLSLVSVDVPVELGGALLKAAEDLSCDLIVMASHIPGIIEHVFASNAGYVASHAHCSVYVVR